FVTSKVIEKNPSPRFSMNRLIGVFVPNDAMMPRWVFGRFILAPVASMIGVGSSQMGEGLKPSAANFFAAAGASLTAMLISRTSIIILIPLLPTVWYD